MKERKVTATMKIILSKFKNEIVNSIHTIENNIINKLNDAIRNGFIFLGKC